VRALHAAQPAVLTSAQDASSREVFAFTREVERFGKKAVHQTFPFTKNGGIDPLGELASDGVDAVYTPSAYADVARALREAGVHSLRASFVLPSSWDTAETRDLVAHAGVQAYLLVPFAADDTEERVVRFVDTFRQKTGVVPGVNAAMAYEAARVAIAAVYASADPFDPSAVRARTRGLDDVPGLRGTISIDATGQVSRSYVVRELRGATDAVSGSAGD
jgi:ABC-type branched-subunit amino acid transport system substrate-binding protein